MGESKKDALRVNFDLNASQGLELSRQTGSMLKKGLGDVLGKDIQFYMGYSRQSFVAKKYINVSK
jgi:hypothetical protein